MAANRKKFRGTLERVAGADGSQGWQIVWSRSRTTEPKPGQKISKKRAPAPLQALGFALDELREARLAPIVDFKGRRPKPGHDGVGLNKESGGMNREMLMLVDAISREKSVERDVVFGAVEAALA